MNSFLVQMVFANCSTNMPHWVDTSAGRLLVPEGIILPVVSASVLTWFVRYIYYSS